MSIRKVPPAHAMPRKTKLNYRNVFVFAGILLLLVAIILAGIFSCSASKEQTENVLNKVNKETSFSHVDTSSEPPAPSTPEIPVTVPLPDDILDGTLFIGDSRMQGFIIYNNLTTVSAYTGVGLNVDSIMEEPIAADAAGNITTVPTALASGLKFNRIYVKMGLNEMGWDSAVFIEHYTALIQLLKTTQPQSKIYVEAILPVTAERSASDATFNNQNIAETNVLIKQMTDGQGVTFLDCSPAVTDEQGNLIADASTDGIHMTQEYCQKWLQYLQANP